MVRLNNEPGVSGGCCSYPHVACLRELEKASGGIYLVEGLYVRLLLCVVYDEEEGHIVPGQCVHAGDSFCSVVSFHISVDCRGYHLDYQNEEYHCNGIYRGIGYARYVAVRHGVRRRQGGRAGHAPVMVPSRSRMFILNTNSPTMTATSMVPA